MNLKRIETEMVRLSLAAGARIMEVRSSSMLEVQSKLDGSPVTLADREADRIIREGLNSAFPGTAIVSEESDGNHSVPQSTFFIVDPLDGTRGFTSGGQEFTVNIAFVSAGLPVAGVVYAPALGRLFSDCVIDGRDDNGEAGNTDCRVNAKTSGIRVVASRSTRSRNRLDEFLKPYDVAKIEFRSSSVKFCEIAAGEADLYPRFGPTMEWDTAAGHAILRARGGDVLGIDDFKPLRYGNPGFRNPHFVAHAAGVTLPER